MRRHRRPLSPEWQRKLDESYARYSAYATRVAALSPEAWSRLYARCAELDDPSFAALMDRTLLNAKPFQLWVPESVRQRPALRVIAGVSDVVQNSIAFAFQVALEFEHSAGRTGECPRRRTKSTGNPATDASIDADFLIGSALQPIERDHPGVATAVRAAGHAIKRQWWLSTADFDAVYHFVEAEIPFASLGPDQRALPPG